MVCPDCESNLISLQAKNQAGDHINVWSCLNCAGLWLNNFEANQLSLAEVKKIVKPAKEISLVKNEIRKCPCCQIPLENFRGESVPVNCQVFFCPNCHGNWFPRNELLKFKKAQETKLKFFKIWQIPLGSPFAILLPVLILFFIAASIPLTVYLTKKNQENRTQASEMIKNINILPINNDQVSIVWTTEKPLRTAIKYGTSSFLMKEMMVSDKPNTLHQVTLSDLKSSVVYYYQIILREENKIIKSPIRSFNF